MSQSRPQYRAVDIAINLLSYSDRAWKIDVIVTHLPSQHVTRMPFASGEPGQPLSQRKWVGLLETVRDLLTTGIADTIEPM